ncbi:hypothetical protein SARC_10005 [Sphaeroforma arctica JP610]|uniref:Uncharacterized protein n=1 Tax=Sphaeroforma arctica JP610 TaxID=667725 RepID=A0A0L0FM24_9EUKA|nr:hypothetical protein SARC_10005 [Sphaeroforma arctica JP610]KNC77531.1 hypothetical protein SARC_10005 [Sphaeroforma arctica JP610]|eukprot:XP_014151433.1 hypothetical protein SARC_10005 [Sphaeroforma arctica JP610]
MAAQDGLMDTFWELMHLSTPPVDPTPLTRSHKFLLLQGYIYVTLGISFMAASDMVLQMIGHGVPTVEESSMFQMVGAALVIIGYFYMQMAKSNTELLLATTVFDRLVILPPLIIFGYFTGAPTSVSVFFVLADPLIALLTWLSWHHDPARVQKGSKSK